jgi:hypothetical protein
MRRQVVGSRRSDRHVESGWYLGSEDAEIFIRCVCERVYIETEKCYSQLDFICRIIFVGEYNKCREAILTSG